MSSLPENNPLHRISALCSGALRSDLFQRGFVSLLVRALPAFYGIWLVLLVVRAIPKAEYGQYGIAIAFMNIAAGLSRGLWTMPLVIGAARGDRERLLRPSLTLGFATALVSGAIALVLLPLLHISHDLALFTAMILLVLVPRDTALGLAQAEGRVWRALAIEAGYFLGSITGFIAMTFFKQLQTGEAVMLINLASAVLSVLIGFGFEPSMFRPGRNYDWAYMFHKGAPIGLNALGEIFLQQGDILLIGIFVVPEVIAPYIAARTLLRMYTLFSQSVNFLVLPSASRSGAKNQLLVLRARLRGLLKYTESGLLIFNTIMWFAAPYLFPAILGEKYAAAVPYFRVIIFATFLEPVYSILANVIAGIGKPHLIPRVLFAALSVNIVLNLILVWSWGLKLWTAPVVLIATYAILAYRFRLLARGNLIEESLPQPAVAD